MRSGLPAIMGKLIDLIYLCLKEMSDVEIHKNNHKSGFRLSPEWQGRSRFFKIAIIELLRRILGKKNRWARCDGGLFFTEDFLSKWRGGYVNRVRGNTPGGNKSGVLRLIGVVKLFIFWESMDSISVTLLWIPSPSEVIETVSYVYKVSWIIEFSILSRIKFWRFSLTLSFLFTTFQERWIE